jgi:hypothetical protein
MLLLLMMHTAPDDQVAIGVAIVVGQPVVEVSGVDRVTVNLLTEREQRHGNAAHGTTGSADGLG